MGGNACDLGEGEICAVASTGYWVAVRRDVIVLFCVCVCERGGWGNCKL